MNINALHIQKLVTPACRVNRNGLILESNPSFRVLETLLGAPQDSDALGIALGITTEAFSKHLETAFNSRPTAGEWAIAHFENTSYPLGVDVSFIPQAQTGEEVTSVAVMIGCSPLSSSPHGHDTIESSLGETECISRCRSLQLAKDELDKELRRVRQDLLRLRSSMNEELEMARTIQESLRPSILPDSLNLRSAALYLPEGKVGGDFYDIIITPFDKVAILIFDVSGHGVPAALIGAMAKMLFSHFIETLQSPADIFTQVNERLCKFVKSEHYLTAFLGIINPIENTMVFSKAGHAPPLVISPREQKVRFLDSRGFFIGHTALANIVHYTDESLRLGIGDKLLLYTDGLTEAQNGAGELYGHQRLLSMVRVKADEEPHQLLSSILQNLTCFREEYPLRDDITIVCLEMGAAQSSSCQTAADFGTSD